MTETILVRYWASVRAAAGLDEETLSVSGSTTLADVIARLWLLHPDRRFTDALGCCSVLVGDRPVNTEEPEDVVILAGSTIEFLPPFAGG
ncbi:MoaD/ThiS family protein [Nocardioides sp. R-C-SC26]|uniref:MoaD/ThiS family protein n=1 Tax=Nocardioides sp. R-C-SC26 TaxID=2870414 RepID=UPI001E420FF7|nr:MoaD/ThiS family protein [Nocardioides sp. R-C-SC26]